MQQNSQSKENLTGVLLFCVGIESEIIQEFKESEYADITAAQCAEEAHECLAENTPDCVVLRYDLPNTDGVKFLKAVREEGPQLPVILVTEKDDSAIVERAIDAGVTDCLNADCVSCRKELLTKRVRDAVIAYRERKSDTNFIQETERLAKVGGWQLDLASGDLRMTTGCRHLHGLKDGPKHSLDALIECYHPKDQQKLRTAVVHAREATDEMVVVTDGTTIKLAGSDDTTGQVYYPRLRVQRRDGSETSVEMRLKPVTEDGDVVALRGAVSDFTDRTQYEEEIQRYERIADGLPVGLFRATLDGEMVSVNQTLVTMLAADSKAHLREINLKTIYADEISKEHLFDRLERTNTVENEPTRLERLDNKETWVEMSLSAVKVRGARYVDGVVHDVTPSLTYSFYQRS